MASKAQALDKDTEAAPPVPQPNWAIKGSLPEGFFADLAALQAAITDPLLDTTVTYKGRNLKYTNLQTLLAHVRPVLAEHGFFVSHMIDYYQVPESSTVHVIVRCLLGHKNGGYIITDYPACDDRATSQEKGSAITYARRYTLSSILGIAGEEDDDGNIASGGDGKFSDTLDGDNGQVQRDPEASGELDDDRKPETREATGGSPDFTEADLDAMSMDELIERTLYEPIYDRLIRIVNNKRSISGLNSGWKDNTDALTVLKEQDPGLYTSIQKHFNAARNKYGAEENV